MIKVNEHNIDRIVRFVVALALIFWAMFQWPVALAHALGVDRLFGGCRLHRHLGDRLLSPLWPAAHIHRGQAEVARKQANVPGTFRTQRGEIGRSLPAGNVKCRGRWPDAPLNPILTQRAQRQ